MNSLLLDADVTIDLHKLGIWNSFIKQNKVHIVATVVHEAIFYYPRRSRKKVPIKLESLVHQGKIIELSASPYEQKQLLDSFNNVLAPEIDAGELESLSVITRLKDSDLKLCTCDKAAIRALSLLQLEDHGISLQAALEQCGMRREVIKKHSELRFRKIVSEGKEWLITGQGIRTPLI